MYNHRHIITIMRYCNITAFIHISRPSFPNAPQIARRCQASQALQRGPRIWRWSPGVIRWDGLGWPTCVTSIYNLYMDIIISSYYIYYICIYIYIYITYSRCKMIHIYNVLQCIFIKLVHVTYEWCQNHEGSIGIQHTSCVELKSDQWLWPMMIWTSQNPNISVPLLYNII